MSQYSIFIMTETFKYQSHATISNMAELIVRAREELDVEQICKKYSLNLSLLKDLLREKLRGYNNTEVAQKLGVHRVTVQRYVESLKNLKESEFNALYNYLTGGDNEKER